MGFFDNLVPSPHNLGQVLGGDKDSGDDPAKFGPVKRDISRLIKLNYLQSIQLNEGDRPTEDYTAVGQNFSGVSTLLDKVKKPKVRASIQSIVNTIFPFLGATTRKGNQDSGWVIKSTSKQTFWDLISWRMGIREVTLNSFTFSDSSSLVSIPINSPKPIWKVTLKTEETIPAIFSKSKAWIRYYITSDNGSTWHRINPLGKPTRFEDDGTVVPRIITFNSETKSSDPEQANIKSSTDIKQIRVKIILQRDTTINNSERLSPVVRNYRLVIYPFGGLSNSLPTN